MENITIRPITSADDAEIARIIRENLEAYHLDIPGTAYFVAAYDDGTIIGGVGVAEFTGFDHCAEIQKLYLSDPAKGKGLGKRLMQAAEAFARSAGYDSLYLETHCNLVAAMGLYEKLQFRQIEKPAAVLHSTMIRFYRK